MYSYILYSHLPNSAIYILYSTLEYLLEHSTNRHLHAAMYPNITHPPAEYLQSALHICLHTTPSYSGHSTVFYQLLYSTHLAKLHVAGWIIQLQIFQNSTLLSSPLLYQLCKLLNILYPSTLITRIHTIYLGYLHDTG